VSAVSERTIEVDGELVHLVEMGDGPPVVFLHGFPSNAIAWRPVQERLAGTFRTLAPDAVGFGGSTRRPRRPLDGQTYAERVVRLLDGLALPRAHLVGLSWGGSVAQRVAIHHPDRVERLVLVAAVDAGGRLLLGRPDLWTLRLAGAAPWLARPVVARFLGRHAAETGMSGRELARGYVDPLRRPGTADFVPRFIAATRATAPDDVSRIGAPTLIISPLADRIVAPSVQASLAERIPGARLVTIPGAGHTVQLERAGEVARMIAGFLRPEGVLARHVQEHDRNERASATASTRESPT
jgi:pimeloyl-ACP methyl ester carboxylesterase